MKPLLSCDMSYDMLDGLYDGVYIVDTDRNIRFWNRAAEEITGYQKDEVTAKCCCDNLLVHVNEKGVPLCQNGCLLKKAMTSGTAQEAKLYLRHKDGHRLPVQVKSVPIRDASNRIVGAMSNFTDISTVIYLKERAAELEKMALIDLLTGVGNRRYAEISLQNKLAELQRYGWAFGVLFADIDCFKSINDKYGHAVGDEALKMVAQTFHSNMRTYDSIFRWGGEEFLLIVTNMGRKKLLNFSERLRVMIEKAALPHESGAVQVTVSIGGTIAGPADSEKDVLKRIDNYMYMCKAQGKNSCIVDNAQFGMPGLDLD